MKKQAATLATTFFNQGEELMRAGNLTEAVDAFRQAITAKPDYPEAYNSLGIVQDRLGQRAEAGKSINRAIKLKPSCPEYYNNLGLVFEKAGLLPQAAELFRWTVKLDPVHAAALNNLGSVLWREGRYAEAETCLRQAVAINGNYGKAYNNLGLVLSDLYQMEEAELCLRRAVQLCPRDGKFSYNLGVLLKVRGNLTEAKIYLTRAAELSPGSKEVIFALATAHLLQEEYSSGWKLLDAANLNTLPAGCLPCACRTDESFTARRVLLFAEQGLGDTLQFVRYAPMAAKLAAHVGLLVQQPLERLLVNSLSLCKVHTGDPIAAEEYDFAYPLLALPSYFHTEAANLPQATPYLAAPRETKQAWQKLLDPLANKSKPRIGVAWAGNPRHLNDRNRSIDFSLLRGLFENTDANWISLQVGERANNLNPAAEKIMDFSDRLTDFAETAGLIANLDLVISVDSAVAHLAGALGKPTWLLLPFAPDWRWQLEREDSPWYPTLRLFRQPRPNDWAAVILRLKDQLAGFPGSG